MKKKAIAILISAFMLFQIAGCGSSNKKSTEGTKKNKTENSESSKENKDKENSEKESSTDSTEKNSSTESKTDTESNTYTDNDNDGKLSMDDLYGEWSVEGLGFRSNVYAMTDDTLNTYVGKTIMISNNEVTLFDDDYTNITYNISTMTPSEIDSSYNTKIENTIFGDKNMTIIKIMKGNSEQEMLMAYDRNTLFYYLDGVAMKLNRI